MSEEIYDMECRTCGDAYDEGGDGWNGECGTCADLTWERERDAHEQAAARARLEDFESTGGKDWT